MASSSTPQAQNGRPVVAVLGLGYAGISAADALDKHAYVVAIDRKTEFYHTFAIPHALADDAFRKQLRLPYNKLVPNGRFVQANIKQLSPKSVTLDDGTEIPFDYAVIATGSSYKGIVKPAVADIDEIHARLEQHVTVLKSATTVAVVGAGLSGVEIASEIKIAYPKARVILFHAGDQVLSGVRSITASVQKDVYDKLVAVGVEVRLNERVPIPDEDLTIPKARTLTTSAGEVFETDIQFFMVGPRQVNTDIATPAFGGLVGQNGLQVDEFLRLKGHDHIFVCGDVADTPEGKQAATARFMAASVAKNIIRLITKPNATLTPHKSPMPHDAYLIVLGWRYGTVHGIPGAQSALTGWLGNLASCIKSYNFFLGTTKKELKLP